MKHQIDILKKFEPKDLNIKKSEHRHEEYYLVCDMNNIKLFMKSINIYINYTGDIEKDKNNIPFNEVYIYEIMKKDNFPHIVQYNSYYIDNNRLNILTSYLDGYENFFEFMKKKSGNMTTSYIDVISFIITYSILYLQKNNIVHCDLHTNNIMIKKNHTNYKYHTYKVGKEEYHIPNIKFDIRIIDFGFAFQPGRFVYNDMNNILGVKNEDIKKIDIEKYLEYIRHYNYNLYYDYKIKLDHSNNMLEFFQRTFYKYKDIMSKSNSRNMFSI